MGYLLSQLSVFVYQADWVPCFISNHGACCFSLIRTWGLWQNLHGFYWDFIGILWDFIGILLWTPDGPLIGIPMNLLGLIFAGPLEACCQGKGTRGARFQQMKVSKVLIRLMLQNSCTSWYGKYSSIYRVLYIPGGVSSIKSVFVNERCQQNSLFWNNLT